MGGILLVAVAIALLTFRQYGITWDEPLMVFCGKSWASWYGSGLTDRTYLNDLYCPDYGALIEGTSYLLGKALPFDPYEIRHLLNVVVGLFGVWIAYRLGKRLAGDRAGVLSALCLLLTPVYYGHAFNNTKDHPFAVAYLLGVWALVELFDRLPTPSTRSLFGFGAAAGVAMAVRPQGYILFFYFGLLLVANWVRQGATRDAARATLWLAARAVPAVALSIVIFFLFWPSGQVAPITAFLKILKNSSRYPFAAPVYFRDDFYGVGGLPRTYAFRILAMTLPEFYFLGLAAVIALAIVLRKRAQAPSARMAFFLVMTFFPLAVVFVRKPYLYNGIRHILFTVPPLAVLVGTGLAVAMSEKFPAWARKAVPALALASALLTLVDMIQLHPYQTVYFNRLVAGGMKEASKHYETDYWGNSYREGMLWVMEHYRAEAERSPLIVSNCSSIHQTAHYSQRDPELRKLFPAVEAMEPHHIFLATTLWNCHKGQTGKVVHVVERKGVPLLYVFDKRPDIGPSFQYGLTSVPIPR